MMANEKDDDEESRRTSKLWNEELESPNLNVQSARIEHEFDKLTEPRAKEDTKGPSIYSPRLPESMMRSGS